jgi:hypothetical protein
MECTVVCTLATPYEREWFELSYDMHCVLYSSVLFWNARWFVLQHPLTE